MKSTVLITCIWIYSEKHYVSSLKSLLSANGHKVLSYLKNYVTKWVSLMTFLFKFQLIEIKLISFNLILTTSPVRSGHYSIFKVRKIKFYEGKFLSSYEYLEIGFKDSPISFNSIPLSYTLDCLLFPYVLEKKKSHPLQWFSVISHALYG